MLPHFQTCFQQVGTAAGRAETWFQDTPSALLRGPAGNQVSKVSSFATPPSCRRRRTRSAGPCGGLVAPDYSSSHHTLPSSSTRRRMRGGSASAAGGGVDGVVKRHQAEAGPMPYTLRVETDHS